MAMKVNWDAWVKLLRENIEALKKLPRTLEIAHTIGILEDLARDTPRARAYYHAIPAPYPPA